MKAILLLLLINLFSGSAVFAVTLVTAETNKDTEVYFKFNTTNMETFGKYEAEWKSFDKYVWKNNRPKGEEYIGSHNKPVFTIKKGTVIAIDPFYKESGFFTKVDRLTENEGLPSELVKMMENLNGYTTLKAEDVDILDEVSLPAKFSISFPPGFQEIFQISDEQIRTAVSNAGFEPSTLSANQSGFHIDIWSITTPLPDNTNLFSTVSAKRGLLFDVRDNRYITGDQMRGVVILDNMVIEERVEGYYPINSPDIDATTFLTNTLLQIKAELLKRAN